MKFAPVPVAESAKSPLKGHLNAAVDNARAIAESRRASAKDIHLSRLQYERLIELAGYCGPLPNFGCYVAIGFGLVVANNSDLPKARETGKAYAVQFDDNRFSGALLRDVLRGEV